MMFPIKKTHTKLLCKEWNTKCHHSSNYRNTVACITISFQLDLEIMLYLEIISNICFGLCNNVILCWISYSVWFPDHVWKHIACYRLHCSDVSYCCFILFENTCFQLYTWMSCCGWNTIMSYTKLDNCICAWHLYPSFQSKVLHRHRSKRPGPTHLHRQHHLECRGTTGSGLWTDEEPTPCHVSCQLLPGQRGGCPSVVWRRCIRR